MAIARSKAAEKALFNRGINIYNANVAEIKIEDSTPISPRVIEFPVQPLQIMVKNNLGTTINQDLDPVGSATMTPNSRNLIDYAQLPRLKTLTNHHNKITGVVTPETILNSVES